MLMVWAPCKVYPYYIKRQEKQNPGDSVPVSQHLSARNVKILHISQ